MMTLLWLTVATMAFLGLMFAGLFGRIAVEAWFVPLDKWAWRHGRAFAFFLGAVGGQLGILLTGYAYYMAMDILARV